jgi:hypothetical protein
VRTRNNVSGSKGSRASKSPSFQHAGMLRPTYFRIVRGITSKVLKIGNPIIVLHLHEQAGLPFLGHPSTFV